MVFLVFFGVSLPAYPVGWGCLHWPGLPLGRVDDAHVELAVRVSAIPEIPPAAGVGDLGLVAHQLRGLQCNRPERAAVEVVQQHFSRTVVLKRIGRHGFCGCVSFGSELLQGELPLAGVVAIVQLGELRFSE